METQTKTDPHAELELIRDRLEAHRDQRQALQEQLDATPVAGDSPAETASLQQTATDLRQSIAGLDAAISAIEREHQQAAAAVAELAAAEQQVRDRVTVAEGVEELRLLAEHLEHQRLEMVQTLDRIKQVAARCGASFANLQQNPDPVHLRGWQRRPFLDGSPIIPLPTLEEKTTAPGGFILKTTTHDLMAAERQQLRSQLYGGKK